MEHAPEAGWSGGNVERAAVEGEVRMGALGVEGVAVAGADAPGGVVRRSADDVYLMSTRRHPGCHFAGIFSDSGELRSCVETVDENPQTSLSPGGENSRLSDDVMQGRGACHDEDG